MEDGDDDTSVTVDGRKEREENVISQDTYNILTSKDEEIEEQISEEEKEVERGRKEEVEGEDLEERSKEEREQEADEEEEEEDALLSSDEHQLSTKGSADDTISDESKKNSSFESDYSCSISTNGDVSDSTQINIDGSADGDRSEMGNSFETNKDLDFRDESPESKEDDDVSSVDHDEQTCSRGEEMHVSLEETDDVHLSVEEEEEEKEKGESVFYKDDQISRCSNEEYIQEESVQQSEFQSDGETHEHEQNSEKEEQIYGERSPVLEQSAVNSEVCNSRRNEEEEEMICDDIPSLTEKESLPGSKENMCLSSSGQVEGEATVLNEVYHESTFIPAEAATEKDCGNEDDERFVHMDIDPRSPVSKDYLSGEANDADLPNTKNSISNVIGDVGIMNDKEIREEEELKFVSDKDVDVHSRDSKMEEISQPTLCMLNKKEESGDEISDKENTCEDNCEQIHENHSQETSPNDICRQTENHTSEEVAAMDINEIDDVRDDDIRSNEDGSKSPEDGNFAENNTYLEEDNDENVSTELPISNKCSDKKDVYVMVGNSCPASPDEDLTGKEESPGANEDIEKASLSEENNSCTDDGFLGEVLQSYSPKMCESTTEKGTVSSANTDTPEENQRSPQKVNGEVDLEKDDLISDDASDCENTSGRLKGVKRKLQASPVSELLLSSQTESVKGNIHFKGFKKRLIEQVSEIVNEVPSSSNCREESGLKTKMFHSKNFLIETPQVLLSHQQLPDGMQSSTPLTEYAQYLGLQPTLKFKCYKCGESGFPSMLRLQEHQNTCLKNLQIQAYSKPVPSPAIETAPSTNFRITRKVYLCSACGTYYENWKLFLHMQEYHNRHICLFCLRMFSQADKLAVHLSTKHGMVDNTYSSPEQFVNEFKGSYFVMCCTCEQIFTERDIFFDHLCGDTVNDQACSWCGLKGAHFPTCRRAFTDSNSSGPSTGNSQPVAVNSEHSQSSQLNIEEKTVAVAKYVIPVQEVETERKVHRKSHESNKEHSDKNRNASEVDDDYDISDAASYCHVNILEPDKRKALNVKGKANLKNKVSNSSSHNSEKSSTPLQTGLKLHSNVKEPGYKADKLSPSPNKLNTLDQGSEENMIHEINEMHPMHSPKNFTEHMEDAEKDIATNPEYVPDGGEEEEEMPSPVTSSEKETQKNKPVVFVDLQKSPPQDTELARPTVTEAESASESSDSGGEDSDGSSSSTEASSEENELEERKEAEKSGASDDSGDKSDSDKMSIVVDEQGNDQETEEISNNHNTVTDRFPSVEDGQKEASSAEVEEIDKDRNLEANVITDNDPFDDSDNIQIAGDDVPLLELTLEENIDVLPIQTVVKECVKISCSSCVYCNHAKKIAVNGKQLVLHLLAEHRFEPVVCSDSGELTPVYGFVDKLKSQLPFLQEMYFNTDSYDSADKSFVQPYDRTYECFHCHFCTTLHKELYVHNRKMHQKTILLCIMCKNNFYSYSELLCHICPGIYVPDSNILFRCCLCTVDRLPSAFRLMVHIRKRHHACDVCLETTGDQQKLSNHVWKHKLHHLCYRCAIAYRNKPDITKHLFWKHGTESVLCKKCLQKKWPHVYHFCIPPTEFLCEECNATFSRAVALKVHKRLHVGDTPYGCDECDEKFISKKLLKKHQQTHIKIETRMEVKPPPDSTQEHEDEAEDEDDDEDDDASFETKDISAGSGDSKTDNLKNTLNTSAQSDDINVEKTTNNSGVGTHGDTVENHSSQKDEETKNDKKTKVVDVYDIPPLNLSSESDDSDDEKSRKPAVSDEVKMKDDSISSHAFESTDTNEPDKPNENESQTEEEIQPVQVVDGVWDNFNNYKANLEKRESLQAQTSESIKAGTSLILEHNQDNNTIVSIVMADHDYCGPPVKDAEEISCQENMNTKILELELQSEVPSCDKKETPVPADDDKINTFCADRRYFNSPSKDDEKKETSPLHLPPNVPSSSPLHPASPPPAAPVHGEMLCTPAKKKQKSPKKKQKQSASSSSSDTSSNSDSSSCTCGTNCSCSSSSSSSSGSSSSSSDSDSSSSEGRRRQIARRERKREKTKKKLESNCKAEIPVSTAVPTSEVDDVTPAYVTNEGVDAEHVDESLQPAVPVGPEEREMLIVESDLDTTETETDEDFYDKRPQTLTNKVLITQKRNQLLLLAEVAPVNNGTMTQPTPPVVPEVKEPPPPPKKKGKTKRHKKAQHNSAEKKVDNKLKLNIPASYYNSSSYALANAAHSAPPLTHTSNVATTPHLSRLTHEQFSSVNLEPTSTPATYHSTGSGSETESKRLSKRKRIPKRFYGDSSDEEAEHPSHLPYKWRKVTPASNTNTYSVSQTNMISGFTYRSSNIAPPPPLPLPPPPPPPLPEPAHVQSFHHQDKSDDDDGCDESDSDREAKRSSSDSSNSDSDNEPSDSDNDTVVTHAHTTNTFSAGGDTTQQKNENLYCYCQCPYDEVSEMIACDGKDCSIEWFHFECVGIMVPPKGKWFCPDCRKKTAARSEYLLHA